MGKFNLKNNFNVFSRINAPIKYGIYIVLSLIAGLTINYFFNRPNFGVFIASEMDSSRNVFVLGVNEKNGQGEYRITKIDQSANVLFQRDLEKSTDKQEFSYGNLKLDDAGNFYIVKKIKNKDAIVAKLSEYPILSETVLMYDNSGRFLKEVLKMNFEDDPIPPTTPYIKRIYYHNPSLFIIANKANTFDILTADPMLDVEPEKFKSFEINPSFELGSNSNQDFLNDIAVISNGRVFYSTKKGEFYAMDNQGSFLNYTNILGEDEISLVGFSVDATDNLYFTNALSGKFYKTNTKSLSTQNVYKIENDVIAGVKLKDLRPLQAISEDIFYAPSKNFESPYHVKIGSNDLVIKDIHGALVPGGLLIIFLAALAVFGIFFGLEYVLKIEIKRIPVAVKITCCFLPVFLIAMIVLTFINYQDASSAYLEALRNTQDVGAKIIAEKIDGTEFGEVNPTLDYMTHRYIMLQNAVSNGYSSLFDKLGDKSDYAATFFVKSNKIYSSFSNKYSDLSNSYLKLNFKDPDMIVSGTALVDFTLEQSEIDAIYNVWNQFKDNGSMTVARAVFKDVHGDISASFAPIKNNSGQLIGFTGNFLEEKIHKDTQLNKILLHSVIVIVIIAFVIFAYMCLVIKRVLVPLKKLENAINSICKGKWSVQIKLFSRDEFADIVTAFNLMSEKISLYTSNLMVLNKEYLRYVPKELLTMIGKEKITNTNLYDYKILYLNVLYLTFNISCKDAYDFKDEKDLFDSLNLSYEKFFNMVEKNHGIVYSFDSVGAIILFPQRSQDAFNTSLQFKEIFIDDTIKKNMRIILGAGNVLIGISGNDKRRGVVIASDEIMQLFNLNGNLKKIGVNHIATKEIIKNLEETELLIYRFIGKVPDISLNEKIDLYEIIDITNVYKKNLYISTNKIFEKGVRCYVKREVETALKCFSDVLKINSNDELAIYYLMLCDNEINNQKENRQKKNWEGTIF